MTSNTRRFSRRSILNGIALGTAAFATGKLSAQGAAMPSPPLNTAPSRLAQDEAFWREVATYYDRADGIVNLEHGYWGKMAKPVQERYLAATQMVNKQLSFYARKGYGPDANESVGRVAKALGVDSDEIVLTRNATESIHNLIRQYQKISAQDSVLYADIDYPSFQTTMQWLADTNGARAVVINLPSRANQAQILDAYVRAFDANPSLKLILVTHVSNQHGLVVPVTQIAREARARGIDVICDAAQSWGLLDFQIADLEVD